MLPAMFLIMDRVVEEWKFVSLRNWNKGFMSQLVCRMRLGSLYTVVSRKFIICCDDSCSMVNLMLGAFLFPNSNIGFVVSVLTLRKRSSTYLRIRKGLNGDSE